MTGRTASRRGGRVAVGIVVAAALLAGALVPAPAPAAGGAPALLAPERGVLFGAHVQTPRGAHPFTALEALEAKIGRRFAIDHYFHPFEDPFPTDREAWNVKGGRIPMISWGKTFTAEVNAGTHDELIRARARALRQIGQPVLLRWFWEMAGNRNASEAGSPDAYIAAWGRLRGIFAQEGATNAAWVWCPDASDFAAGRAQAFYPGDGAVDWVCADGYNWRHPERRSTKPRSFEDTFSAFYTWAAGRNKPIMIGEFGTLEDGPGDKAAWVDTAREVLKTRFPGVRAVVYFHSLRHRHRFAYDWRMDTSDSARRAFTAMGADPWFNPKVRRTLPDTAIDAGPEGTVAGARAVFRFSSTEADSTFQCRLDRGDFEACASPRVYPGLADGPHAFEVRALNPHGRPDPTPVRREWQVDTTPPAVASVDPPDGAGGIPVAQVVSAVFSEDLDPASVTVASITLVMEATGAPVAGTVTYDGSRQRVVFDPDEELLPLTAYRVTIPGGVVADAVGNTLAGDHTWRFTTGGDLALIGT